MDWTAFDNAAPDYERVRGFPPGIAEVVASAALELLDGRRRLLEIGIGTGRIGRPLLAHGVDLTGIDLSANMLAQLNEQLPPNGVRPALVLGDAVRLPFEAGSFEAVVTVHVFQLIADWQAALSEVRRVLLRGGVFLSGYDWRPADTPGTRLLERWREIVRAHGGPGVEAGTRDFTDLAAAVLESGAGAVERQAGDWTARRTLARHLETIEHRTWSGAWQAPEGFFDACLAELAAWATAEYGSLDREFEVPHRFQWQRFSWPAVAPTSMQSRLLQS